MKKILLLIFISLVLVSCQDYTDSPEYIKQQEHRRQIELEQEKQRTIMLQAQIDAEANKTPEQRKLEAETKKLEAERKHAEEQLRLQKEQAKSLEYLENSKKVHDTVDAVILGAKVFDAFFGE